jgi:hypothetical protein
LADLRDLKRLGIDSTSASSAFFEALVAVETHRYREEGNGSESSCLTDKLPAAMAQSPADAAVGAESNTESLRQISLATSSQKPGSLPEIDPRIAYPAMNLSGCIISATFCIPHSVAYRKGGDWVSRFLLDSLSSLTRRLDSPQASWYICPLRLFCLPLLRRNTMEPYTCWLDRRDK